MKDFLEWSFTEIAADPMGVMQPEAPVEPAAVQRPSLANKWADHMKARSGMDLNTARTLEHPLINSVMFKKLDWMINKMAEGNPETQRTLLQDVITHFQDRLSQLQVAPTA